jgi:hypothetical protein
MTKAAELNRTDYPGMTASRIRLIHVCLVIGIVLLYLALVLSIILHFLSTGSVPEGVWPPIISEWAAHDGKP